MRRFGEFLLARNANAIVIAFLCALLPVFNFPTGFIAAIIVGLVTLQKGAKSGLYLLTWVALPSIAELVLHRVGPFDVLVLRCIGVWFFASLFNRYRAWNYLLEIVACVGVILIFGLHFFIPNLQQWWMHELTVFVKQTITEAHWKFDAVTPALFATRLSPIATGLASFFFFLGLFIEVLVARYWQTTLFEPGSFGKEFRRIRVGRIAALLMCVLVALVVLKVPAAFDALPLAMLPFFVAGLSLMHFWKNTQKFVLLLLMLMYAGLFFLPAVAISIVAIVAFVDAWFNFRKNKMVL